jgi:Protein of unknown function (DUF3485)
VVPSRDHSDKDSMRANFQRQRNQSDIRAPGCLPSQIDGWTGTARYSMSTHWISSDTPNTCCAITRTPTKRHPRLISSFHTFGRKQQETRSIHQRTAFPVPDGIPILREVTRIARPDGSSFPAKRYVFSKGAQRQLVLYWFQAHGRAVASEYSAKYLSGARFDWHEAKPRRTSTVDDPYA